MQRPIITIPQDLLRFTSADWRIDWRGQASNQANNGVTQTVFNAFPRFVGSPEMAQYRDGIARWRAIRSAARGRIGVYRVRMCDPVGFESDQVPPGSSSWLAAGTPHALGSLFSNGRGYWYDPFVTAASAAPAGAETVRIDTAASGGVAPNAGQIMSSKDWPFIVSSVVDVGGGFYDLEVNPPLRKPLASDDVIQMQGVGLFEAANAEMGSPAYDASRFSDFGLDLQEYINR